MVLIIRNFLSGYECDELNNWVDIGVKEKWLDNGCHHSSTEFAVEGYKKRVTTRLYADRFVYPNLVCEVNKKITVLLDINDLKKSVFGKGKDGVVVNCTFPGGEVFIHKDPKEGALEILRCNIMTRAADFGGKLVVDNKEININTGDLHVYLPSTVEHYVTTVHGKTARVLWMFGYQCSNERFKKICSHHRPK